MEFIKNNALTILLIVGAVIAYCLYTREGFGYTWFQVIDLDEKPKKLSMRCNKGCGGECNLHDGSCNCSTN